jgi:hypothetical protein
VLRACDWSGRSAGLVFSPAAFSLITRFARRRTRLAETPKNRKAEGEPCATPARQWIPASAGMTALARGSQAITPVPQEAAARSSCHCDAAYNSKRTADLVCRSAALMLSVEEIPRTFNSRLALLCPGVAVTLDVKRKSVAFPLCDRRLSGQADERFRRRDTGEGVFRI